MMVNTNKKFALIATLAYALVVIVLSSFHEVWRDEVVFMTIAAESQTVSEVIARLKNFGHPGLWFLMLDLGHRIIPHFFVLKVINLLVSIIAVYLFLAYAPFARLQKILFMFGVFPFYLYPVVNRDYGISMLLVFLFCMLYEKRFERFVMVSIVLFLLANAHMHSLILTCAIFASLIIEYVMSKESRQAWMARSADVYIGFGLIALGILCSVVQIMPDEMSNAFRPVHTFRHIVGSAIRTFLMPGLPFPDILGLRVGVVLHVFIWALVIYFSRNRNLLVMFGATLIGLGLFFHLIFPSIALRHQGAFFILLIMMLWLDQNARPNPIFPQFKPLAVVRNFIEQKKSFLFTVFLICQIPSALVAAGNDIALPYSSSKALGEFLKKDPVLRNAVVIPEPDTFAEALPYYADNKIYFPREGRFGKYTHLTKECRSGYSLAELLDSAKRVRTLTGQPVVIILGHPVSAQGPFKIFFSWSTKKTFDYSPESFKDFQAQTVKIASFHPAITDEEYDLYLLK